MGYSKKAEDTQRTQLLWGDCMERLREIPDGSIDMLLTDPPYSSGGLFAGDRKANTQTKYTDISYQGAARFPNFSGDNMDQRSFTEFLRMVLAKAREKAKPESIAAAARPDRRVTGCGLDLSRNCRVGQGQLPCNPQPFPKRLRICCMGDERPQENGIQDWRAGFPRLLSCFQRPVIQKAPSDRKAC